MAKAVHQKKRTILVVEDDFFLIKVLQVKLTKAGFDVHVAADGILAMEALNGGLKPDLVVLDLVMPRKDGFEVLQDIRAQKQWKSLPVIVLTNLGQETDMERVKNLGVKQYLVKSDIAIDDVVDIVRNTLAKK